MSNNESEGQETSLDNNKAEEDNIIPSTLDKIDDDNVPKTDDKIPKTDDNIPKTDDNVPKTNDNITKADDNIPKTDDNVPKTNDNITKADDNIPKTESEMKMKSEDENLKELENFSAQVVSSSNVDNQAKVPDTKPLS